ncbi:MAG: hypothetical protein LW716_06585 [Microcystis sp. 53602_E8]|nr:hypothetical protein [Microcystis sp. 53602_E8]
MIIVRVGHRSEVYD